MGVPTMQVLRSNGENEARAYVEVEVPPSPPAPAVEIDRVRIVDPRDTVTVRRGAPRSTPPNPQQRVWPPQAPPAVDLPDALPATKAQRVILDPALVARWRAQAARKENA
jgi:hypothetical protein